MAEEPLMRLKEKKHNQKREQAGKPREAGLEFQLLIKFICEKFSWFSEPLEITSMQAFIWAQEPS